MNNALAQVERLWANLLALGGKRLMALAMIGVTVFGAITFAGYYLSRPSIETLYSGLDRDDVVSIGSSLREAGINFDVSADGATVTVPVGQAAARPCHPRESGDPVFRRLRPRRALDPRFRGGDIEGKTGGGRGRCATIVAGA